MILKIRDYYSPLPGDIFACWGADAVSRGISLETSLLSWLTGPDGLRWSPSHVAIAANLPTFSPDPLWFESTSLASRYCLVASAAVSGTQAHRIQDRVEDYLNAGGRVAVYRLTSIDRLTYDDELLLTCYLKQFLAEPGSGRPAISYDTIGAALSGTRLIKYLPFMRSRLDSVFCSELIAALLQRLCRMNRDNPTRYNPGLLLRTLVRQGTYGFHREIGEAKEVAA